MYDDDCDRAYEASVERGPDETYWEPSHFGLIARMRAQSQREREHQARRAQVERVRESARQAVAS